MPQLSQIGSIYASQLFWLAIVFAAIYFGIGRGMVPKIEKTVDDRHARIQGDLDAAQAARGQLKAMDDAYQAELATARGKAGESLAAAQAQATASANVQLKAAAARVDAETAAAMQRIAAAKAAALDEIAAPAVDLAEAIVAKVSGAAIDRALIADKVKAELAHG